MHLRRIFNPRTLLAFPLMLLLIIGLACGADATATAPAPTATAVPVPTDTPPAPVAKADLVVRTHADLASRGWYVFHHGADYPLALAHTGLVAIDVNGDPMARLAKSWTISEDLKTYTFNLNDWVWSDGVPVVAEDVKFSIEEVLLPHHAFGQSRFGAVDTIETPDDKTVIVHLSEPREIIDSFTDDVGPIVPKHQFEGKDILDVAQNEDPITAGPYMFSEWESGSHVTLARNPHWVGEEPYFERLIFRIIPDENTAVLSLKTGEVDWIPQFPAIPYRDVVEFQKDPKFKVVEMSSPTGDSPTVLINGYTPPLDNVDVRKAIATAIDTEGIIQSVYLGTARPMISHMSAFFEKYKFDDFLAPYEYNPEKAAQMLDAAGFPVKDGKRFTLKMTTELGAPQPAVADAISGNLADVDIEVQIDSADSTTHWGRIYGPNVDDPWKGFNMGLVSAAWTFPGHLFNWFHSSGAWDEDPTVLFRNAWNFKSTEFDNAIDNALKTFDQEHLDNIREVQRILADDMSNIPIATLTLFAIANKCLQGLPVGYGLFTLSPFPQGDADVPFNLRWDDTNPDCQ